MPWVLLVALLLLMFVDGCLAWRWWMDRRRALQAMEREES
jgi:hypothetical protein